MLSCSDEQIEARHMGSIPIRILFLEGVGTTDRAAFRVLHRSSFVQQSDK